MRLAFQAALAAAIVAVVVGCGGGGGGASGATSDQTVSDKSVRQVVDHLPFEVRYRRVAHDGGTVVAGTILHKGTRSLFAVIAENPKITGRVFPKGTRQSVGNFGTFEIRHGNTKNSSAGVGVTLEIHLCKAFAPVPDSHCYGI